MNIWKFLNIWYYQYWTMLPICHFHAVLYKISLYLVLTKF
jgi:hypothetical protein